MSLLKLRVLIKGNTAAVTKLISNFDGLADNDVEETQNFTFFGKKAEDYQRSSWSSFRYTFDG
jgi:hypothetical protein